MPPAVSRFASSLSLLFLLSILPLSPVHAGDTWSNIAPGIDRLYRTTGDPMIIHLVVVDLTRPEIWLRATKEEERGRTVGSFASLVGATVAINGDWFDYDGYYPVGMAMGDGWGWTGYTDTVDWSFFACNVTKECGVDPAGNAAGWTPRWWNVVGGNGAVLLIDGVPMYYEDAFYSSDRHPRSAIGVSADGNTLFLVVVDGRIDASIGMTFNEMTSLLQEFGAWDGMMLDGGGSSTLVVNGSPVNNPSDGSQRVVSNHLGVMSWYGADSRCTGIDNGKYCLDATRLATCEGGFYEEGDCGYFGLTCEESGDFAYCVDPRCTNGGQAGLCPGGTLLGWCTDGVYYEGDCAGYGLSCAEAWGTAWCAGAFYQGVVQESSFPMPGAGTVDLSTGETVTGTFEVLNTGLSTWTPGGTFLAPVPRDQASALADSSWISPTRAATLAVEVPPGSVGSFSVTLRGNSAGDVTQYFGLLQEGVTWFADYPGGGGPTEDAMGLTAHVTDSGNSGGDDDDATGVPGDDDGNADDDDDGLVRQPWDGSGCGCSEGMMRENPRKIEVLMWTVGVVVAWRRRRSGGSAADGKGKGGLLLPTCRR